MSEGKRQGASPAMLGILAGVAVLFAVLYFISIAPNAVPTVGTVLGPEPEHPGFVLVTYGGSVRIARDPYAETGKTLEPGEPVLLQDAAYGPGIGFSGTIDSVDSDDAEAVKMQRERQENLARERAQWAVRASDAGKAVPQ